MSDAVTIKATIDWVIAFIQEEPTSLCDDQVVNEVKQTLLSFKGLVVNVVLAIDMSTFGLLEAVLVD